ncbi:cytochrome P450 [Streptomyces sp. NPDC059894]|uniref:cytochrome P450 family protein n=1 Tax=unclassified Streptomyces TaxID=2593676 RepID=UPI00365B4C16
MLCPARTAEDVIDLGVLGARFTADPYPLYAKMRRSGPVHRVRLDGGVEAWLVVRHQEARAALADPRLTKDWSTAAPGLRAFRTGHPERSTPLVGGSLLAADPPRHTRLRRLVTASFSARRVAELGPRIQQLANRLVDDLVRHPRVDAVSGLAFPLPIMVICELLGVPELDQERFREWSTTLVTADGATPAYRDAAAAVNAYLDELIEAKRSQPQPGDDLLAALLRVTEEQDDHLSTDELRSLAQLLLVAGHETTVNLIANSLLALLQHPRQLAALRADYSLLEGTIEETLRHNSPVECATWRFAVEPVEIGGVLVPGGGSLVLVALAAAGHDEDQYPDAAEFDITRASGGHLAFGHGIHYCLGAPLARLEARIALRTLLERCPALALDTDAGPLAWRPGMLVRGPERLPLLPGA